MRSLSSRGRTATPLSAHDQRPTNSACRTPHSALVAVALLAGSQAPDPWPVLDRASQTYQSISTLSADFVQIVENPLVGAPDTTRGKLYQMRPSRFAMRFAAPKGDRIVADGRYLWLYTPSTTPGQVIRAKIPAVGTTGPHLTCQCGEQPRARSRARYRRAASLPEGMVDGVALVPTRDDQPYSAAVIWVGRADGLVRRLEITEASGQLRTVTLSHLKVNAGVPGREFTFSPPSGVQVVESDSP